MSVIGVLAASAVVSQLYAGYSANKSARREAGAMETQGALIQEEQDAEARRYAEDVRKFRSKQKLAFLANGVTLQGTPGLVMEETSRQGQEEVNAISRRGKAYSSLYYQKADIMRNEGRAGLIGGIGNALSSGAWMYSAAQSPTKGLGGLSAKNS